MPLGASRLLLSISAMRRTLAEAGVAADFLLTQAGDYLITQRGELILANQSDFVSGDYVEPEVSLLLTQDLNVIALQNDKLLATEQLFETASLAESNGLITQAREALITQDGLFIVTGVEEQFDVLLTQDGNALSTQDLNNLAL